MSESTKHDQLVSQIPDALAGLLEINLSDIITTTDVTSGADIIVNAIDLRFAIEFKSSASAGPVTEAVRQVLQFAQQAGGSRADKDTSKVIPVVAVPFMGDVGKNICHQAGVGWLDLSGNGNIKAPGLRIMVDGKPNRFITAGRPANTLAPKSSRIVRWLLIDPSQSLTQRQIASATCMSEGFVSKIVRRLEQDGYLTRESNGAVRAGDPEMLLDAWRDTYQFSGHTIIKGHVAARSGDALTRQVSETLRKQDIKHAATGLAAAWAYTRFVAYRTSTFFLGETPDKAMLEKLGVTNDPRGTNLWLALPNDIGVFHGAEERDGIPCVHPVQAYVDLKAHPERAPEAADQLRHELLNWKNHDRQTGTRNLLQQ